MPSGPGPVPNEEAAPGLGEQFRRTRAALTRLVRAHVQLLRAELGEIAGIVKGMALKAAIAVGLAVLLAIMLYVGGFLFLGEWLFGSIGWGLAHGTLLPLALIVALGLGIVGGTRGPALISLVVATVVAIALALLLGTNVLWQTADYFATQLAAPLNSAGAVGMIVGALLVGLLLALLLGWLGGLGGAIGGLLLGAVVGALLGFLFTAGEWTWGPAVGLAITLGLIIWPLLNLALTWPRLDLEAHFSRLAPRKTMAAVAETREWMEEQWRSRSPMSGRK
jgi:hypothetical protein